MNLFIDIETIPSQAPDAMEQAVKLVKVPANYKNPEAIEKYRQDNAADFYAKTGLNGLYGEICSIAWAFEDRDIFCVTRTKSMTESELLVEFFNALIVENKGGEGKYTHLTWIGHNVIDFDLRFIKQRAMVNSIRPPVVIPADARHGSQAFDTMKEWAGWKGFVSLDALCDAFGVPGKADVDGSMVGQLWADEKFDVIHEYNKDDVVKTRNVYRRMVWS